MKVRRWAALVAAASAALAVVSATGALAVDDEAGFKTAQEEMLDGRNGWTTEAIISVGDTLPGGYVFEAIPDGISIARTNGRGTADILVNHELSLVPFPLPSPTVAGRSDFTNSIVSRLRLHQHSGGVLKGDYTIPSSANYQRFCSNFLVSEEHGFERDLLLTNEEARDFVNRTGTSWPAGPGAEQAGVVVALDVKSGEYRSIYGMGRHNHENSVGIPGYGYPVVLSGDDTFDAPASQLFLYKADSGEDVWNDRGTLYAFRSNDAAVNDYGDVTEVMPPVPGEFIPVPTSVPIAGGLTANIATGKRSDGAELRAADLGYPSPPSGVPDGPQWVLETWSNLNNAFQFIRVEDTAYDRTNPRVVYLADTGEPRAVPGASGRLARGPSGTNGAYMNGRIFKVTLGANPLQATLDILPGANFDAGGYANANVVHQPDNVETTGDALYIQEDPGSHNSANPPSAYPRFANATNARVWRYDLTSGALTVVAEVDQAVPGAPTTLAKGTWESSGIVDASAIFGPGAFLVDVQAHSWEIARQPDPPVLNQVNLMREAGQLLLLRAPGS
jgi:hypothetical protein